MGWTLERAIVVATRAHQGQVDLNDEPYVLHPLRVMTRVHVYVPPGASLEHARMAAVLHDVVEDTPYESQDLREDGCPERVLQAVDVLTHRDHEPYDQYVEGTLRDPLARAVKMADVEDNISRLDMLEDAGLRDRLADKYAGASRILGM